MAPPFKTAEFDIMYNKGISYTGDLIDLATKYEIAHKSGAFYSYKELKLGQGRENAKSFLATNDKVLKSLEKDVLELIAKRKKEEDAGNTFKPTISEAAPKASAKPATTGRVAAAKQL